MCHAAHCEPINIHTTRQSAEFGIACIEENTMCPGLLLFIDELCHLLAKEIEDSQRNEAGR
jgi:hypothetical protein